jgi:hypothetical protein
MGRKKKGAPVRGYTQKGARHDGACKCCRALASMMSFNPPWQGLIHMYRKGASPCPVAHME